MEQWKMIQKKNKKMELIGIISVILCLTIGTVWGVSQSLCKPSNWCKI